MRRTKVILSIACLAYVATIVYKLPQSNQDERVFNATIASIFFFLYLLLPLLFIADVKIEGSHIAVDGWRKIPVPIDRVRFCFGLYLFPWQLGIVISRFPLNFVMFGDSIEGSRRSLFQRGVLAQNIYARMKESTDGSHTAGDSM